MSLAARPPPRSGGRRQEMSLGSSWLERPVLAHESRASRSCQSVRQIRLARAPAALFARRRGSEGGALPRRPVGSAGRVRGHGRRCVLTVTSGQRGSPAASIARPSRGVGGRIAAEICSRAPATVVASAPGREGRSGFRIRAKSNKSICP